MEKNYIITASQLNGEYDHLLAAEGRKKRLLHRLIIHKDGSVEKHFIVEVDDWKRMFGSHFQKAIDAYNDEEPNEHTTVMA